MSKVIGFAFFLLLLAAVAFITLKDMKPLASSTAQRPFTEIDWRPLSIGEEPVDAASMLRLRFANDGKLNGHGGCNRFSGTYTKTPTGIDISPVGATRMACPEPQMRLETRLFDALGQTAGIENRGGRLILSDASGRVLAVFEVAPPPSPGET